MASTLERLQVLEEQMQQVVQRLSQPDSMVQMLMNKTIGIEQSVASLGKTLSAVAEELTETDVMSSVGVMARLRKNEDETSRQNVKALLGSETIEPTDTVTLSSLVALEQKIINTATGKVDIISEYNLVGMNSAVIEPVWRDALQGKTVGDTVTGTSAGEEEEVLTVKEIYSLREKESAGEEMPEEMSAVSGDESISFDESSVEETVEGE